MALGVGLGNSEWIFWFLWMRTCQLGKVTRELGSWFRPGLYRFELLQLERLVLTLPRSPGWLLFLGFEKLEPRGPLP